MSWSRVNVRDDGGTTQGLTLRRPRYAAVSKGAYACLVLRDATLRSLLSMRAETTSDLLIVRAHLGLLGELGIDLGEDRPHIRLGGRALHHDDELGLVG